MSDLSNPDMEESLLSAILHDPDSIPSVVAVSDDPDLMHDTTNRQIWRSIVEMHKDEKPVDPTSLISHITQRGYLAEQTAEERIGKVVQLREQSGNAEGWTEMLEELKNRRDWVQMSNEIPQMAEDLGTDLNEIQRHVTNTMANRHSVAEPEKVSEVATSMLRRLDGEDVGFMPGNLKTGMAELDNIFDGVMDTDFVGILARPKWGKTSLMIQLILGQKLLYPGGTIDVFSMEMSEQRLTYRMVAQLSGVEYLNVKNAVSDPDDVSNDVLIDVRAATKKISEWEGELRIYTGSMTPQEVCQLVLANATREEAAGNDYLSAWIDNFQSFRDTVKRERLEKASSMIKDVTLDAETPVFVLSQVNRNCEDENRPPRIKDAKGTGQLEQDFDRAITIDRPDKRNPHMSVEKLRSIGIEEGWATIGVDKNREGREGSFEKFFHGPTMQFLDDEPKKEQAVAGAGRMPLNGDASDSGDVIDGSDDDAEDIFQT